jgi:hypothetical protein
MAVKDEIGIISTISMTYACIRSTYVQRRFVLPAERFARAPLSRNDGVQGFRVIGNAHDDKNICYAWTHKKRDAAKALSNISRPSRGNAMLASAELLDSRRRVAIAIKRPTFRITV